MLVCVASVPYEESAFWPHVNLSKSKNWTKKGVVVHGLELVYVTFETASEAILSL